MKISSVNGEYIDIFRDQTGISQSCTEYRIEGDVVSLLKEKKDCPFLVRLIGDVFFGELGHQFVHVVGGADFEEVVDDGVGDFVGDDAD